MEKQVMSVRELAKAMGIALPNAYALTETRGFPCIKIGQRRKVIPIAAFQEWLKKTATGSAS